MKLEWDPAKSDACFSQRVFDFAYVNYAFLDANRLIKQDHRWDYGEDRYQMLGQIDARLLFVTYTVRSSVIRIISARKANHREVKEYEDHSREA